MRHLFSSEGRRALAAVMELRPLLAFDFDGTLAPITERPDQAKVPPDIEALLRRLRCVCPVAVVTGRSVADVIRHLHFGPHQVVGNHGAEQPGRNAPTGALNPVRACLARHAAELAASGIHVEDKGLSLAIHYRLASDRHGAERRMNAILSSVMSDVRVFGGKCVINVVPLDAPDKGDAVHALVRETRSQSAVFVGDDINDEAVFERAPGHWLTVRVGRDDTRSSARYFVRDHDEVCAMLSVMASALVR